MAMYDPQVCSTRTLIAVSTPPILETIYLGNDLQRAVPDRLTALVRHAFAGHPPLRLEHRFNDVLAAAADTQAHGVVMGATEQALVLEELHNGQACLQS